MVYNNLSLTVATVKTRLQPTPIGSDFSNVHFDYCLFDPEADYVQVLDEARKHALTSPNLLLPAVTNEKWPPPTHGLSCPPLAKTCSPHQQHTMNIDFLEFQLPGAPLHTCVQGSNKVGGRTFWKNLFFWRRGKKNAVGSYSESPTLPRPEFRPPVKILGRPVPAAALDPPSKRAKSGPIYSDGISVLPSHQLNRPVSGPISSTVKVLRPSKSDSNRSPYLPLHRTKRIPSGPLYLP